MVDQEKLTMCLTFKTVVPHELAPVLEDLYIKAASCTVRMLEDRDKSSSKYYKEIPCVLAKSLISKYQRNKKLRKIKSLVLPVCGDKGKQVKIEEGGIRVPAFFKKKVIPCTFPKPIVGFIRQVEFFKRNSVWFMTYSYNVEKAPVIEVTGVVGVDRNSVGNTATLADPHTGKVKKFGVCTASVSKNFKGRRKRLQKKGKKRALVKLKRKQRNRFKDNNHKVAHSVVNYARKHRKAIILEDLGNILKGKAKRYVKKAEWGFYQLEQFIRYKASLHGIPVIAVDPAYTSKKCSKCGEINNPSGKNFKCKSCSHVDHRDANAAFNIAQRFLDQALEQRSSSVGLIGNPLNLEVLHV
jgi:IS605 OrfB family transposase